MVVGARQSFQFFRQNTWFLENNRALHKVLYRILHYLISIIKWYKYQSIKFNFILTTRATLRTPVLKSICEQLLLWLKNNQKTGKYGTETIFYLAPKIWSLILEAIKSSKSLEAFKSKIRLWEPDCPCRLRLTCNMSVSFSFSCTNFFESTIKIMYLIR